MALKNLYVTGDHYNIMIFQQQENLETLIQTRLEEYYNNIINVRISLDGYGSKIRKISRSRPTVSNETILATKQEFFFTEVALVQSITDIVLVSLLINTAPQNVYFILHYHLFFVKIFFFEYLYLSEYDIRMFLFVSWLRNRPSIKYVRNQGNVGGSSKMCTGAYSGNGVSRLMCTYALTLSLSMFLSYGVLFYLQKFNLTFIQKGCVCQKWLFLYNEINFCCNEIIFFYFKLFFRFNVSQNTFDFN